MIVYAAVIDSTGPVFGLLVRKWEGLLIEGYLGLRSNVVYRFITAYKSQLYVSSCLHKIATKTKY